MEHKEHGIGAERSRALGGGESPAAIVVGVAIAAVIAAGARGQPPSDRDAFAHSYSDKRDFTLFNPTPDELRRPLSADRPDVTESPYTVDAGVVQLEMSFFDYARNGSAEALAIAPFNLKLGLFHDTDIQFVVEPYVRVDDGDETNDGFGDLQIRLKYNIWGNDEGGTALAVMPFIKFPTASNDIGNDHVDGGIIVPFAMDVAENISLGLMFETDFVYDEDDDGYDAEFIGTASLGFEVTRSLGWYLEGVAIHSTDADAEMQVLVGTGLTYEIRPDVVLDAGINFGLEGDADDVNIFSGITVRF